MSFGDLPFVGGYFFEIHIKGLKMCKRTKHKYHSTQVQWREAHNQAKQGPKEVENKAKPKSKHLNCT
jgi:hypothetical protein